MISTALSPDDLPAITLQQIEHFFVHYKDLEPNKCVKIEGWGAERAKTFISNAIEKHREQND